jgi:hypothetical protein
MVGDHVYSGNQGSRTVTCRDATRAQPVFMRRVSPRGRGTRPPYD